MEGPASLDSVLAEFRAIPRALPGRDDNVLRRGQGPHFVLTRWKFQDKDVLVARVDVQLHERGGGTAADVKVSPAKVPAALLLVPIIPLLGLPLPELAPGQHTNLLLLGMAVVLAAVFWGVAWSNVPAYDEDRSQMLALIQSLLDGEPLESSRTE